MPATGGASAHFTYLLVGGGMTAAAAAQGIRDIDSVGTVGMIGDEPHPPYSRPPLSKGLWKGESRADIWRPRASGVEPVLGRRIVAVDPGARRATDDRGAVYAFDSLLFATGGTPRRLPNASNRVIYFRTLGDYDRLRAHADRQAPCVVIGGGFIGSEVAAALRSAGCEVTMVVPEPGLGARTFPADLSASLVTYYREQGVTVHAGEGVTAVAERGEGVVVTTTAGHMIRAAVAVAGIGLIPDSRVAEQAGLKVDNGIVVDEQLRTSAPGLYAAGDVANFFSPVLGTRMRVEHEDNANTMGRAAGRNMAGAAEPYRHLPFFYSDLFAQGYEAVGDVDARLETVQDWKERFREGVIYYLRQGRVRGVLLWNTWGQVDAARALIAEPGPFTAPSLQGRLPRPASAAAHDGL
jgi:NADPH-dependent 2,4-dienoyl-CoA reductase/sulfur reductase-like enzyme